MQATKQYDHFMTRTGCIQGSALFYFNDPESFSPRGVIPIELASVSAGQRVQGMLDRRDKYIISITVHSSFECSKAVYLLSARSTHSQERWIEVPHSSLDHVDAG